jgi:chorismate mutase
MRLAGGCVRSNPSRNRPPRLTQFAAGSLTQCAVSRLFTNCFCLPASYLKASSRRSAILLLFVHRESLLMNRSFSPGAFCAITLSALLALLPVSVRADGDDTALTSLIALVSQRLALAEPVAHWKWVNHQPITDTPRENALLADVEKRAAVLDVDPAYARAFFRDQIDASKEVQNALFASWRATRPPEGPPPDLATTTRPQLDQLTRLLIAGLARVQPLRNAPDCPSRVAQGIANWKSLTRYDSTHSSALTHALGHVCESGGVGATG